MKDPRKQTAILILRFTRIPYVIKESLEFACGTYELEINSFDFVVKSQECRDLVIEQVFRLDGIVQGIVQFVCLKFVVLQQGVIWLLREKAKSLPCRKSTKLEMEAP